MSEIPYFFDTPVPKFFRENNLFNNPKSVSFVTWCFSRCSTYEREVVHESHKLAMKPYSFIFGRDMCGKETGLSAMEIRTQTKKFEDMGLLVKLPNDKNNRFSLYGWAVDRFLKPKKETTSQICAQDGATDGFSQSANQRNILNNQPIIHPITQLNNQPKGQQKYSSQRTVSEEIEDKGPANYPSNYPAKQPAKQPQSIVLEEETSKESHQSSYVNPRDPVFEFPALTDDFLQKKESEKKQPTPIEVFPGVSMSQRDLDACISIKGSLDSVKHAVEYIMRSSSRKRIIKNWPQALSGWEIKNDVKPRLQENEEMGKRLQNEYGLREGWRAIIHTDRRKDIRGILFQNTACTGNALPVFIPFVDPHFREKAARIIREKRMQKAFIPKS